MIRKISLVIYDPLDTDMKELQRLVDGLLLSGDEGRPILTMHESLERTTEHGNEDQVEIVVTRMPF